MEFKVANLKKQNSYLGKQICLNFNLQKGQVLAVLGENSAGKSSCLRLLAGVLTPSCGQIFINNKSFLHNLTRFQQKIGYLPEELGFNKNISLLDQLVFFARVKGIKNPKSDWRFKQLISEFGLELKLKTKIGNLSKGFKQRLALASVLLNDPSILILDEPTQGLDFAQKNQFYQILHRRKPHTLSIISTHYLQEALEIADKILVLKNFEVIFLGSKSDLLEAGKNFAKTKALKKSKISLATQAELIEDFLNFGDLKNAPMA